MDQLAQTVFLPEAEDPGMVREADEIRMVRSDRRQVVKMGAAVAAGVLAAGYVTPSLRRLGVPAALAMSGSGQAQGCSPGYYKTGHPGAKYVPTITFGAAFGLSGTVCGVDTTQTIQYWIDNPGGGPARALAFQASAAYVNAVRGINYPLSVSSLKSLVQAAYVGCKSAKESSLNTTLNGYNNLEGNACS